MQQNRTISRCHCKHNVQTVSSINCQLNETLRNVMQIILLERIESDWRRFQFPYSV